MFELHLKIDKGRLAAFAVGAVLVGLVLGVGVAFANHDASIVHACVKKDGSITIVDEAEDCKTKDTAIALATEAAIDLLQAQVDSLQALVTTAQNTANAAQTTANANAATLTHFTTVGDDITIAGANLHVVNGTGDTGTVNSLGNVIIGYNEMRASGNDRRGSHMLVVGNSNNYSSFGGIVVGFQNETSGALSSVFGGRFNTASGKSSSISGGNENLASGELSVVSGGAFNTASGVQSSVSGGKSGWALGTYDWVAGGLFEDD